jgi:hypothetical protein
MPWLNNDADWINIYKKFVSLCNKKIIWSSSALRTYTWIFSLVTWIWSVLEIIRLWRKIIEFTVHWRLHMRKEEARWKFVCQTFRQKQQFQGYLDYPTIQDRIVTLCNIYIWVINELWSLVSVRQRNSYDYIYIEIQYNACYTLQKPT